MPGNKYILILCTFFIGCFPLHVLAEKDKDVALQEYSALCRKSISLPQAPQMCDTLADMARKANNNDVEIYAAAIKLECYYFKNDEQQIINQVEVVKKLCRAYQNYYYYYFVWGNRLITFYIKQNKINIALYEIKKMLQEAQADNYQPGIAECFRSFAVIYLSQSAFGLAMEYYQKEIDVYEKAGIDYLNLPVEYSTLAQCAIELNLPDKAAEAIEKGREHIRKNDPYQTFVIKKANLLLCLYRKDFAKAEEEYAAIEKLFKENTRLDNFTGDLYDTRLSYYKATGQRDKAMSLLHFLENEACYNCTAYLANSLKKQKADLYMENREYRLAAQEYRAYIEGKDTLNTKSLQNSVSEFNTILEVELLQKEKNILQMAVQKKQLYVTYLIIGFLVVLLVTGWIVCLRIYRLNSRLKKSESDLRVAKESAEQASKMKTEFIRNMSHEIRTPLNSIVGFSQVLNTHFSADEETREFANIISQNTFSLLRLVDDVLEISALDQNNTLVYDVSENINNACYQSMEQAAYSVPEGVQLEFTPTCPELIIKTNSVRVAQVLTKLLHNAAKFTKRGKITLNYKIEDKNIIYSVTDTGIGISEDKQEVVFERFVKVDSFTRGTGLGLPLCRIIANGLGGSLTLDKTYKDGCRFLLTLPFVPC